MIHLIVRGESLSPSSWNIVACHLLKQLRQMGAEFRVHQFGGALSLPSTVRDIRSTDVVIALFRPCPIALALAGNIGSISAAAHVCFSLSPDSSRVDDAEASIYNRYFDHVIVPSEYCRQSLLNSHVQVPIHVVRLGFDPDVFREFQRDFRTPLLHVLYIGAGDTHKNPMVLLNAMEVLKKSLANDRIRMTMKCWGAGDIKLRETPEPGSGTTILFGNLPQPKIVDLYEAAHLLVLCSRGEGFGLTGLEALATGMPLVATKFGGILEYANDHNAFLLDGISAEASNGGNAGLWRSVQAAELAALLDKLERDRGLLEKKAAAARASVADLIWEKTAAHFWKIVQPLLS